MSASHPKSAANLGRVTVVVDVPTRENHSTVSTMYLRRILTTKSEMLPLQSLLVQLNPNLLPERYELLLDDMLKYGYRMLVLYDGERPIAVTGIWVATKFYSVAIWNWITSLLTKIIANKASDGNYVLGSRRSPLPKGAKC